MCGDKVCSHTLPPPQDKAGDLVAAPFPSISGWSGSGHADSHTLRPKEERGDGALPALLTGISELFIALTASEGQTHFLFKFAPNLLLDCWVTQMQMRGPPKKWG